MARTWSAGLCLVLVVGCSSDDKSESSSSEVPVIESKAGAIETTVGSLGARLDVDKRTSVTIPAGAIQKDVTVSAARVAVSKEAKQPRRHVVLDEALSLKPEDLELDRPMKIEFAISDSKIKDADLTIVHLENAATGEWRELSEPSVSKDPGGVREVRAETRRFGVYAPARRLEKAEGDTRATAEVKAEGARIELSSGAAVSVPPDAIQKPTRVEVSNVEQDKLAPQPSWRAVSAPVAFTPHGTTFKSPVTLELPVPRELADKVVRVARLDHEKDPTWEEVKSGPVVEDGEGKRRVQVETDHFSIYVVTVPETDADRACGPGFESDGSAGCRDVDECARSLAMCGAHSTCANFAGGFACDCDPGYGRDAKGVCIDVDECRSATLRCPQHASCTNTEGGFSCACQAGFASTEDGSCADVDECLKSPCDPHASCHNIAGSYECVCRSGYVSGVGDQCVDVDECASAPCGAHATCVNSPGGYACGCDDGFSLAEDGSCLRSPLRVEAAYAGAESFDAHVRNSVPAGGLLGQPGTLCDGSEAGDASACIHAGVLRRVAVPHAGSCLGLTLTEQLGVFDWICDDSNGVATFFSTGFAAGKGLVDLLSPGAWKPNSVSVASLNEPAVSSGPSAFWPNPVVPLPDNSATTTVALTQAGTVYTLAASRASRGYTIEGDGIAIVSLPGARLSIAAADLPLNCNLVTGTTSSPDGRCLLTVSANFVWVEANLVGLGATSPLDVSLLVAGANFANVMRSDVVGGTQAISLSRSRASRVHETSASQAASVGLMLYDSTENHLAELSLHHNGSDGLHFLQASRNRADNIHAFVNQGDGIDVASSQDVWLRGVRSSASAENCIEIEQSTGTRIYDATLYSCNEDGLYIDGAVDTTAVGVTVANMRDDGVEVYAGDGYSTSGSTLLDVTIVNTDDNGLMMSTSEPKPSAVPPTPGALTTSTDLTVASLLIANTDSDGVETYRVANNTFADLISVNNDDNGLDLYASSNQKFTGALLVGHNAGGDCDIGSDGAGAGLAIGDASCQIADTSDATRVGGADLASSFAAAVSRDDASNASDTLGSSPYARIGDFTHFENPFRGWARNASVFPSSSLQGSCSFGGVCNVWDARLRSDDAVARARGLDGSTAQPPFASQAACPASVGGNVALTDRQSTPNTFLRHARELVGDGIGDDDGLCESDEACVFGPNFGAYQGEGTLLGGCFFSDGIVSGVLMRGYAVNGAPIVE